MINQIITLKLAKIVSTYLWATTYHGLIEDRRGVKQSEGTVAAEAQTGGNKV